MNQLTNARAAANGKKVALPKPVTAQTDLSHLPHIERLTAARKLAKQHKLATDSPAPITPVKAARDWWPINERDEAVKTAWLAMEAATAAYNAE